VTNPLAPTHRTAGRSALLTVLAAVLGAPVLFGAAACRSRSLELGEAVDAAAAVTVSHATADSTPPGSVVVSGRVSEVCRSSGCWLVLEEVADGRVHQLYTDLKPEASFTVPTSVVGRQAVVSGRLVGDGPDRRLLARGLVLRP
jgi:hypothetical protein